MPFYELENGEPGGPKTSVDVRHLRPECGYFPKVRIQLCDGFAYRENETPSWFESCLTISTLHRRVGTVLTLLLCPHCVAGVIASYGLQTLPAILHDKLCSDAKKAPSTPEKLLLRREADRLFRVALGEPNDCDEGVGSQKVPFVKRWVLWAAVRLLGVLEHSLIRGVLLSIALARYSQVLIWRFGPKAGGQPG